MAVAVGILLVCLLIGAGVGYLARARGAMRVVYVLTVLGVAGWGWLTITARAQQMGWDALGYAIFANLFVAPAVLGLWLGVLVKRMRGNG